MILTIWQFPKATVYLYFIHTNCNIIPVQYLYLLDKEELNIYNRYKVLFKKMEFLVGRVLAKSVLSKYLETRPENIHFIKNKYGKLYLEDRFRQHIDNVLQFNIAHSHNMIVCAVTLNNEIGVDIEKVNGSISDIVDRFFTTGEKEYIARYSLVERDKIAYKIWTMKEAFIKAKGLGLSMELDSFDVTSLTRNTFIECVEPKEGYYISVVIDNQCKCNYEIIVSEVDDLSQLVNLFDEVTLNI